MRVAGVHHRALWLDDDGWSIRIIDQTLLPHRFHVERLTDLEQVAHAIRIMQVRGAPLIGVAAAYGVCLGLRRDPSDSGLQRCIELLNSTRPTAVNLRWALETMRRAMARVAPGERAAVAYTRAAEMAEQDIALCQAIGAHGVSVLRAAHERSGGRVNVLTHCNAGWLATVDWGTALAPVFRAHRDGIPVHVWVDETRPRNQGFLTAWELHNEGVAHTIIADNTGGHLMQHGQVDLCLVGSDRTTAAGDVCNKIGTYLKALAAHDNGIPFYVALPSPTIDWSLFDGNDIPIEERDPQEVHRVTGRVDDRVMAVTVTPPGSPVANYAFDVTPGRLVTGLVTERGICESTREGLERLFPERRQP